ncbi:MAG: NAD(P)/FAD-dependent oxidoreductase [Candidatus Melainabacteria bacterium]
MPAADNQPWDVVVIGGGAAGYFTAISVAEHRPGARILIVEAARQDLAKVKISGGGRCNVTHACFQPAEFIQHYPRGGKALKENFRTFGPTETVAWFADHGVALKTEADGRMFPVTDDSQTILDCLRGTATRLGFTCRTASPVAGVLRQADGSFQLTFEKGHPPLTTRHLVLATGGSPAGYRLAESLGHALVSPCPSLFTLKVNDPQLHALAGISVPAVTGTLTVPGEKPITQSGPLLITHWGLSGPCILRLSAWGARHLKAVGYQATVTLDWFPEIHADALRLGLLTMKQAQGGRIFRNARSQTPEIPGAIPARLWDYLLRHGEIDPDAKTDTIKDKALNRLAEKLKRWPVAVSGKGAFKEEFVTAGGVALKDMHLPTYESRQCPQLYIVGELLDVDGVTGGFNFQNAWTSGFITGRAIAAQLRTAQ